MSVQLSDLTVQVIKAGEILLNNPSNEATHGVFDIMRAQWLDHVEKLREIVQLALDPVQFVRACGLCWEMIKFDLMRKYFTF